MRETFEKINKGYFYEPFKIFCVGPDFSIRSSFGPKINLDCLKRVHNKVKCNVYSQTG